VKFLEADRVLKNFNGGKQIVIRLCMSGTHNPMEIFLKAEAAKHDKNLDLQTLPFGTLRQHLMVSSEDKEIEAFLLFPWDLCVELDWRTGVNEATASSEEFLLEAQSVAHRLSQRENARLLYMPAPMPPVFADSAVMAAIADGLVDLMGRAGAHFLDPAAFDFGSLLSASFPISGHDVGDVSQYVIDVALQNKIDVVAYVPGKAKVFTTIPAKVLITDLDNTLWDGILGEDGLEGIRYEPEGRGFKHFVYQTFLRKLKNEGTLLAAVTRNDPEEVERALACDAMVLSQTDFVAVIASYNAKSSQIKMLAEQLNLGPEAFVFVDDNPVELAEVEPYLGASRCLAFPEKGAQMPQFIDRLAGLFFRTEITDEDKTRTDLYRRRFQGVVPTDEDGEDLTNFLKSLAMTLTIHDRSNHGYERCVQLINKTNQFNLNGIRLSESQTASILDDGGRLYGATLEDRSGSHGEILACLINSKGAVESFVMSCRVFERQVEFAFMCWLLANIQAPLELKYQQTIRNEPIRIFLEKAGCDLDQDAVVCVHPKAFMSAHGSALEILKLEIP